MAQLIIEYRIDTRQPGYAFQPPTGTVSEALLKAIWRQAMPRGQGWGNPLYQGACALKCFPVSNDTVALSRVSVTDQVDEQGRKGIRRAEIDLIRMHDIVPHIKGMLEQYPESVRAAAHQAFSVGTWTKIIESALPKIGRKQAQIVFAHMYSGSEAWQVIEAIVLNLAVAWPMRALPGWGKFFSFTTLALTNEDESRIVALPIEKARQTEGVRIITLSWDIIQ